MDDLGPILTTLQDVFDEGILRFLDQWAAIVSVVVLWLAVAGQIGRGAGFDDLFRDDDHIVYATHETGERVGRLDRSRWGETRGWLSTVAASPAFWSSVGLALLGGLVWLRVHHADPDAGPGWVSLSIAGAVVTLIGWYTARVTLRRPRLDVAATPPKAIRAELLRVILGHLAGAGFLSALYAGALAVLPMPLPSWVPDGPMLWLNLLVLVCVSAAFRIPYLVSGLAVVSLVIGLLAGIGVIGAFAGTHGEVAAVVVLVALVWGNGRLFKGRVPGLDYEPALKAAAADKSRKRKAASTAAAMAARSETAGATNPNEADHLPSNPDKIPLCEPLERWLDRERKAGRDKPVLTILATSGGAYRASFWTALVLDRLAAEAGAGGRFAGLPESIRLIAGASGGMVAGAYFTALSHRHGTPPTHLADAIAQDTVRFQQGQGAGPMRGRKRRIPIPRDSLSPVVQQFIRRDLPAAFWPGVRKMDRGTMLDEQWLALQDTLGDIATSEANARCPSIIFSPMLIETGSVVYVSNLDLRPMRETRLQPGEGPEAVNDNSVELLDACPEARRGLSLATAVRLNATFPYVSPALSLPVLPNRRVVDSGYYDNYGGDVIAGWLATPCIRDFVCKHCAGVAILQVRAFRRDNALEGRPDRLVRALQGITSPPEGLFSARAASQLLRNNQQLKLVEQLYTAKLGRDEDASPFIRRFVFEAYADASMSWYLPDGELESLRRLLPHHPDFSLSNPMPPLANDRGVETTLQERRLAYQAQQAHLAQEMDALAAFWAEAT